MTSDHPRTQARHLVIGAGLTGLAVAAALKRHGIPYDHAERNSDLGGNWLNGVYDTVHIISSKKTTQYSDVPMPEDYPDFPSAAQMLAYLRAYAQTTGIGEHIRYNAEVSRVTVEGDPEDGRWRVHWAAGGSDVYGGVIICNGHHWDMRWPDYPGQFEGEILHSKQYRSPEQLRGKRVLVVGGGNSGCDIAVEAARFAEASHISLRRGYWFLPKTVMGRPTVEYLRPWMPGWLQVQLARVLAKLFVGPYSRYGLQEPRHAPFSRHPTINSQLLYFLKHGTITPHRDIARLEGREVVFVDGERTTVDLIVYATGYHVSVPMVEDGVIRWENGFPDLIGGIFPKRHRNLYVVGIGQPRYGAGPLLTAGSETLARMIQVQPRLKMPLGEALAKLGAKPLDTYLMDPHASIRRSRLATRLAPLLPYLMGGRGSR